jgi:hypothetical protein
MITKEQWIEFLDKQYKSFNIDTEEGMTQLCTLATVEEFLRQNGEI